jgi:hypothetical protein
VTGSQIEAPPATGEAPPQAEAKVEEKPEGEKPDPALDTKANPFKAEEIEFSSADVSIDPEIGNAFAEVVNKHGIPRNAVAELVALQEKTMQANSEASSRAWKDVQAAWVDEVTKDAEIGGKNWPQVQSKIGQLIDTHGSPELREAFDLTGAGNNPAIVRFMSKIANVLSESGHISAGMPSTAPKTAAEILYPNQGKT